MKYSQKAEKPIYAVDLNCIVTRPISPEFTYFCYFTKNNKVMYLPQQTAISSFQATENYQYGDY